MKQVIELGKAIGMLQGGFAEKRLQSPVEAFDLAFGFGTVWCRKDEFNTQNSASPLHPLVAKLFSVIEEEPCGNALKYAAGRQLFAVVIGDGGTGKTTALRRFCDETQDKNCFSLYLSDSKLTPRSFYKSLLEQLGFEARYHCSEAKRQLHKEIEMLKGLSGTYPVALIDEAHLLGKEMLEEIRFLLNFKMDSQSPMALILSGQTELWDKLMLQSYAAIRQRIDIKCVVGRLDRSKTNEYILAQFAYAGCVREIFTEAAIEEIFKFSDGIPRLINRACTESLMYGAQNRKTILDDRMAKMVIEQELIGGALIMAVRSVQIPLSLFFETIDLLERIDTHMAQPALFAPQQYILSAFLEKRQRLLLRKAYSDIIFAHNDDDRCQARMEYLQKRSEALRWR